MIPKWTRVAAEWAFGVIPGAIALVLPIGGLVAFTESFVSSPVETLHLPWYVQKMFLLSVGGVYGWISLVAASLLSRPRAWVIVGLAAGVVSMLVFLDMAVTRGQWVYMQPFWLWVSLGPLLVAGTRIFVWTANFIKSFREPSETTPK